MPLHVTGIDHVQIAVPESKEAECLAFYRDIFGFPGIPKPEYLRGERGAWFQIGGLQLHVGDDPEPSPKSQRHICFLVADLAEAKGEVVAHGMCIEEEAVAAGLSRFFIRDPAGNRLEIGQGP
jgi:catechol 2,3-dioxygenase-like lactoylglutathione lyase family enzyme